MSKTILLGGFSDEVYTLTFDDDYVTHDVYENIFDDDEGEDKARDYLENDTYLWKSAVENDNTTLGLNEWIDDVINMDSWQSILGEDNIVCINDEYEYYCYDYEHKEGSDLPIDDYNGYSQIELSEDDFNTLVKAIADEDETKIEEVFAKYPEFEASQLKEYA